MKQEKKVNSLLPIQILIDRMFHFYEESAFEEDLSREYELKCLNYDDEEYTLTIKGIWYDTSGSGFDTDSEEGGDFCDELYLSPATIAEGTEWNKNLNLLYAEIYDMMQKKRKNIYDSIDSVLPLSDDNLYNMAYEVFQALGIDDIVLSHPYTLELEDGETVTFQKICCGTSDMDDAGGMYYSTLNLYMIDNDGNSHNIESSKFKDDDTQTAILEQICDEMEGIVKKYFRMNTIFDPVKRFEEKTGKVVFLAGPITDAPSWQKDVLPLADKFGIDGVTFLSPRKVTQGFPARRGKAQWNWETWGLNFADVVLFWIPNAEKDSDGRVYAQTTRVELGESLALGRKVILGIDTNVSGADYLKYKAEQYGVKTIHTSLEGCLEELKSILY